MWRVWEELLAVDSERDTYRFDVVNIGRQVLGDYFLIERDRFAAAYAQHDRKAMDAAARRMTGLLADINLLTACHPEFSLERWIAAARGYHLTDYASRTWSGMISTYYAPRWRLFIERVMEAARTGRMFDHEAFDREIRDFECRWADASHPLTFPEAGDAVRTARELASKYKPLFDAER